MFTRIEFLIQTLNFLLSSSLFKTKYYELNLLLPNFESFRPYAFRHAIVVAYNIRKRPIALVSEFNFEWRTNLIGRKAPRSILALRKA